jgi:hypothetical protein
MRVHAEPAQADQVDAPRPGAIAPSWLSLLLALEIASACGQAQHNAGNSAADPPNEPRQSALGRSPHPGRAPQARHRYRPDLRCEVHGTAKTPSILLGHPEKVWWSDLVRGIAPQNPRNKFLISQLVSGICDRDRCYGRTERPLEQNEMGRQG